MSPVRRPLPGPVRSSSSMSMEQLREARRQHEENTHRARESAMRLQRADEDARRKKAEQQKMRQDEMAAQHQAHKRFIASVSPATTTHHAPSKRPRRDVDRCRLVWNEEPERQSFVDMALQEGEKQPVRQQVDLAVDAARDGLVIVGNDGVFGTNGLDECTWYKCKPWRQVASVIECKEGEKGKMKIVADGGLGAKRLGAGTFNFVVELDRCQLPGWIPIDSVLRITRPDQSEGGGHKYQSIMTVAGEAHNAMYASANGFGVKVYAIAAFEGIRVGRALRYGMVYALEKAKCDMFRTLESLNSSIQGIRIAKHVTEMLYQASRCGVAFVDIKPGNILEMKDGLFRLIDYDPVFFLIVPEKDWRALLLLNLAFLSCHVRNGAFGTVSIGWASAVKPVLKQLVDQRASYDSGWLFTARSVCMDFEVPTDSSEFELQRMMSVMATSYFYGKNATETSSANWGWQTKDQAAVNAHRRVALHRKTWPPSWDDDYVPLIKQMVDFATERAV